MRRRDLDYLVIVAMLMSGLYVTMTGLVTDLFGLHQFVFHRYAGYAWATLTVLHLALNWGRVTAYVRWRFRGSPDGSRCARPRSDRVPTVRRKRAPLSARRGLLISVLAAVGGFALGRLMAARRLPGLPVTVSGQYAQGDLGQLYHQWSKPGYTLLLGSLLDWGGRPGRNKVYADAARIALPDAHGYRGLSLEEAMERRRSRREYVAGPLSLEQLSRLLHTAGGITAPTSGFRAAPSAGALYPIETYAVVHDVEGLEPGVYHYAVVGHALERLHSGDLRTAMVVAGIGQEMLGQAQVCFVLSAIFQRTRWRYRERTYRYVLLEAGHIGQNLYLAATSMGLGACAVGAFLDDELNDLLGLDGEEEAALYIVAVGKVRG